MINNLIESNKLIQFLMGLNESYDSIRSQILILDPLPTVNKAYSMVPRIEKQRTIQIDLNGNTESSAMLVRAAQHGNPRGNTTRKNQKKDDKTCEHYKMTGHTRYTCFKLNGYPDWYKQLKKDKGAGSGKGSVNMVNTPLDED